MARRERRRHLRRRCNARFICLLLFDEDYHASRGLHDVDIRIVEMDEREVESSEHRRVNTHFVALLAFLAFQENPDHAALTAASTPSRCFARCFRSINPYRMAAST